MDQDKSKYVQVSLSFRTKNNVAKLSRSLDNSFSSLKDLKNLVYKHYPELETPKSAKSDGTDECIVVRWKDAEGNLVVLKNDIDVEAVDFAHKSLVELHIETVGFLPPAISKNNARPVTGSNWREKARNFNSERSTGTPCKNFEAGYCKNGDACTYFHNPANGRSWRREATAESSECPATGTPFPRSQLLSRSWFNQEYFTTRPGIQLAKHRVTPQIQLELHPWRANGSLDAVASLDVPNPQSIIKEHGLDELEKLVGPPFQEPTHLACFSQMADGKAYWDDRCLRRFRAGILSETGADLNEGYESFVDRTDDDASLAVNFGNMLACLRAKSISLENVHFVTFRNNLTKILGAAYRQRRPWEVGVHKRFGTIYLYMRRYEEMPLTEIQNRSCYWGRSFEKLATENQNDGAVLRSHDLSTSLESKVISANEDFRLVLRKELGSHRIIMGANMDTYDVDEDGKRYYIEVKATRKPEEHSVVQFAGGKLFSSWLQSFLGGVPQIAYGFRDDQGKLVQTDMMSTVDIIQRVRSKQIWEGGVCVAFGEKVLTWLYDAAKENEDYVLRFVPRQNRNRSRFELLRADGCPESITKHVEELSRNL